MAFCPPMARSLKVLLSEAKPLIAIFSHAQRISYLQRLAESQLQPAARKHCHVASWHEGNLLFIVTDGHWATRLRYQQKYLQRQLMIFTEFASLTHIQFKVQPPNMQQNLVEHNKMGLSDSAAKTIQSTACSISNPSLRVALERLASRANNPCSTDYC
ncbi:DUF721 domain-containing protein [Candidatus Pseudomonas adelgestsugas]|uniref:RNA-binding protein n=1 Tax=Candidatus Pseudomonas adelgestsugas TaxID=1302376 RepID=A0ABX5R994_9PSED|nr:DciA family protein [Candidatus Pseudomonas adelgestsugas]QAX82224.1 hypothetical protein C3B55_00921 [Candidatus Pseudomonas adelgestsugas]